MRRYYVVIAVLILVALIFTDLFYNFDDNILWNIINFSFTEQQKLILTEFRIPKLIAALLVGTALSISGFQMQTVFRNPLAGPYILGISSGAALGVAVIILASSWINFIITDNLFSRIIIVISSFLGSFLVLIFILTVSRKIKNILTILIFGVLFGYMATSIINIMQYFAPNTSLKTFFVWTMGSLSNLSLQDSYIFFIIVFIGFSISIFLSKQINLLMLGDDYALTSGVNVKRLRLLLFISSSLLAGSVVAFCGPIGFIGITVPHIVRMIFKTSSVLKIQIYSVFVGGIIMLLSDIISHIFSSSLVLPINSVTAFFGIPVVFYILFTKKNIISM